MATSIPSTYRSKRVWSDSLATELRPQSRRPETRALVGPVLVFTVFGTSLFVSLGSAEAWAIGPLLQFFPVLRSCDLPAPEAPEAFDSLHPECGVLVFLRHRQTPPSRPPLAPKSYHSKVLPFQSLTAPESYHFKVLLLQSLTTSKSYHFKVLPLQNLTASKCYHFKVVPLQSLTILMSYQFKALHFQSLTTSRFTLHSLTTPKSRMGLRLVLPTTPFKVKCCCGTCVSHNSCPVWGPAVGSADHPVRGQMLLWHVCGSQFLSGMGSCGWLTSVPQQFPTFCRYTFGDIRFE